MEHIVSLSGGKDSTAMLLMMIERNMPIDHIVCVDMTKEFPEMYDHLRKLEEYILPLKIDFLKINFDYYLGEHIKRKGKNKGKSGYGWSDFRNRWCTRLKSRAIKNYVDAIEDETVEYIGIAYDEKHRAYKNLYKDRRPKNVSYPLIEWKISENECLKYCYSKGFYFGGLYEHIDRVSCFCCPLSGLDKLRYVYWKRPELWNIMKKMDQQSYRDFRPDYTLIELEKKFNKEK